MNEMIRVVIAEDLDVFRKHFTAIINKQSDMQVVAAVTNGKQAIKAVEDLSPNIVLMDIEMEVKLDGINAAKQIMAVHPDVKVVFLTIHEDDETVFNAFENGAVDYMLKSTSSEEIIKALRLAHQGKSPIRSEIASKIRTEFSRIRKNEATMLQSIYLISRLTATEHEILNLLLQGKRPTEIAQTRQVEITTVKSQINQLLKKFHKKRTKEIVKMLKELHLNDFFYHFKNN